jgi:hypothetical protein
MGSDPTSTDRALRRALLLTGAAAAMVWVAACHRPFEGRGELRAQSVALQREVEGLRDTVARLERNETVLPLDEVAVVVDATLIRDLIAAQLPFDADVDRYHVRLVEADVIFEESEVVRLRGVLFIRDNPALAAEVTAVGVLEKIMIDDASSTLTARIAVDHIGFDKVAGLESILSEGALDELARSVRVRIADQLPAIQIPIKVQHTIELPAVELGPIRLEAASLPLQVSVSRVVAGRGRLWIAIRITPGEFVHGRPASPAARPDGARLRGDGVPGGSPAASPVKPGGRR